MIVFRKINSLLTSLLLYRVFRHWIILNFISPKIRCSILRYCGARIGKNVYFSNGIYIDNNAEYFEVEEDVLFSPNVTVLFHLRDMGFYERGKNIKNVPHKKRKVVIKKGASIGTNVLILPGVVIGEGAVIGAGTVVTKDVEAWSVVVGNPMRTLKKY